MINPFTKHSVSIINPKWEFIKKTINVKHIPRREDLIFIEDIGKYFRVLNIIHTINKKQGIFIVVETLEQPQDSGEVLTKEEHDNNTDNQQIANPV
jgi:hypothetical protein